MNGRWEVIIGISLMVLFEFINWRMGGTLDKFTFFVMPLILLLVIYFLITGELKKSEQRFKELLRNHLPEERFINDEKKLRAEMVFTIKKADKFIMTTGGRARDNEYLSAIEEKVLNQKDLEYWRVILGDHIHHRLHIHLEKLLKCKNAHIKWHGEERWGNILVTDDQVILLLPNPTPGAESALIVPNPQIVQNYKEFVLRVFGEAKKEVTLQTLNTLCVECRAKMEST